jgi:hypothetical protein
MQVFLGIKNYKACQLNDKHSKVVGYGLEVVYCYVTGEQKLEGAHSSLVDAKAQCRVVTDDRFKTFIDKPMSIVLLEDVWAAKRKTIEAHEEEIARGVPDGWSEQLPANAVLLNKLRYNNSYAGGAQSGPTSQAYTAFSSYSLADLFLCFFTIDLLEMIAKETKIVQTSTLGTSSVELTDVTSSSLHSAMP